MMGRERPNVSFEGVKVGVKLFWIRMKGVRMVRLGIIMIAIAINAMMEVI
jgi:hypothetical protein